MPQRYDVVVVGAGPAGCAAAAAALRARPDARVAILDRARFPRDKPCGDGVAGEVVDLLDHLGLDGPAIAAGYRPISRLRVRSPQGFVVDRPLRRPALVIPRLVLDARLLDQVRGRGADVIQQRVRTVDVRADGVVIDDRLAASVLIGADGAESTVRRAIGARPNPSRTVAVAIRGYAPEPPGQCGTQLLAMGAGRGPAYAWSFPIGDGTANVGYGEALYRGPVRRADLVAGLRELVPGAEPDPDSLRAHREPLLSETNAGLVRSTADRGWSRIAGRGRPGPCQPVDRRGHLLRGAVRSARRRVGAVRGRCGSRVPPDLAPTARAVSAAYHGIGSGK